MADYFCTHCGCRHEPLAHRAEPRWNVTVEVAGNPAFETTVDASDEWKARTKAMAHYPHPLRGAAAEYQVRRA